MSNQATLETISSHSKVRFWFSGWTSSPNHFFHYSYEQIFRSPKPRQCQVKKHQKEMVERNTTVILPVWMAKWTSNYLPGSMTAGLRAKQWAVRGQTIASHANLPETDPTLKYAEGRSLTLGSSSMPRKVLVKKTSIQNQYRTIKLLKPFEPRTNLPQHNLASIYSRSLPVPPIMQSPILGAWFRRRTACWRAGILTWKTIRKMKCHVHCLYIFVTGWYNVVIFV